MGVRIFSNTDGAVFYCSTSEDWLEQILEEEGWACMNCETWRAFSGAEKLSYAPIAETNRLTFYDVADRMELLP